MQVEQDVLAPMSTLLEVRKIFSRRCMLVEVSILFSIGTGRDRQELVLNIFLSLLHATTIGALFCTNVLVISHRVTSQSLHRQRKSCPKPGWIWTHVNPGMTTYMF